jgi:hypothetical protein
MTVKQPTMVLVVNTQSYFTADNLLAYSKKNTQHDGNLGGPCMQGSSTTPRRWSCSDAAAGAAAAAAAAAITVPLPPAVLPCCADFAEHAQLWSSAYNQSS